MAGTSLFQIIFTTAIATFLQALQNQTVDVLLALLLLAGGVIGAQFGTRASGRLRGEQARALLATLVLSSASRSASTCSARPPTCSPIAMRRRG